MNQPHQIVADAVCACPEEARQRFAREMVGYAIGTVIALEGRRKTAEWLYALADAAATMDAPE